MRSITKSKREIFSRTAVFVLSTIGVAVILYAVHAGSLNPSAAPASTLKTLEDIHDVEAGTSYDSSGSTRTSSGNAIQISKCIIYKLQGGSC